MPHFYACFLTNYYYFYIIIMFIIYIKERKTLVTQTYKTITKHTQHRNKLYIYMITLIYKYTLYNHSHMTEKKHDINI